MSNERLRKNVAYSNKENTKNSETFFVKSALRQNLKEAASEKKGDPISNFGASKIFL